MTIKIAACIGGGVIGGGWVARFLLHGWDVQLFDPSPNAERTVNEMLANARQSLPALADVAMPTEGKLTLCNSIEEAVTHATWIQESVPERLEIKHTVMAQIQSACLESAVIGSSTSGFKPSQLQEKSEHPEQIVVAHPFNPVYLLPLVEVVPSENYLESSYTQEAQRLLTSIGMKPLLIRKEIDAHIADRLLEAVWREGLWLINDGIASTEEIDDAIRFGFGLRWAQMGLFETYRIAGGEAGMKHFISQFGPCLEWPWTKLMDVPNLTEELIDTIANQSDAQSGHHSIRELERIRDNNLVGIMRAQKNYRWGVGQLLHEHDQFLATQQPESQVTDDYAEPIITHETKVLPAWIDYNGHMNEMHYLQVFSAGTDQFMRLIGCDEAYVENGSSYFTTESHICHIDEVKLGEPLTVTTQLISHDAKRFHIFHRLIHSSTGHVIATGEHMLLHVDLNETKVCPTSEAIQQTLEQIAEQHQQLSLPEQVHRAIGKKA